MAKKKQKPDFSKPKLKKADSIVEIQNGEAVTEQSELSADADTVAESPEWNEDDTNEETPEDSAYKAEVKAAGYDTSKYYVNLPTVVIAGRPNVGKSTLFNRFMHRRLAIVDPTPGVTRDPVEAMAFIMGKPVHLVDTGGYKLDRDPTSRESEMDELVVQKTVATIKTADKILLLLESGVITGEDEEFIQLLRPYWNRLIVAVNKCEGGKGEDVSWNYLQYGFKELVFISADHGDHITDLATKIVADLDFSKVEEGEKPQDPIRIAILGKPNTGKSTLSNRLTHSEKSIVSDYAGTTRDVVEGKFSYAGRNFEIMDTAGIRRKKKVHENVEYYSVNRAIKTLDKCDVVFLMIDAQEGLADQDKKICSLAYERGRGIIFVLNKWDTQEQSKKTLRSTVDYIKTMFGHMNWAPILPLSALHGEGIKDLLNKAIELYEQLTRRVETSALNKALSDWLFHYPPPASKAIHFKIRYMTQTSTNPVAFRIFCTSPDNVPESYVTYLKNSIRKDLGFDQIPVELNLKPSRKRWEERTVSNEKLEVRS
ncbi:MAG: ribosome biogenesis GTPase Der [Treponema sp.]|nr:ribosome biogenesis GTPase Der [Treponema sp.]